MLERRDLTDDERATLEGDREALTALAERLAGQRRLSSSLNSGNLPNLLGESPDWRCPQNSTGAGSRRERIFETPERV
jgi:hypothetical protein